MARTGLTYSVAADTRDFSREVKSGVLDTLEDTQRALEDVAREGDQAGRKLEDSMRDAGRRTEDMDDSVRKLNRQLETGSRSSFRSFDQQASRSMDDAGESVQEFKEEAISNVSEFASSFDGDMRDVSDLVQGTFGGLASGLAGPLGLAAAGVGIAVGTMVERIAVAAEQSEERVAAMYEDMLESGERFLTDSAIQQNVSDIVTGAEGAAASMDDVRKAVEETGLAENTVLLAFSGHMESRQELLAALSDRYGEVTGSVAGLSEKETVAMLESERHVGGLIEKVQGLSEEFTDATGRVSKVEGAMASLERRRSFSPLRDNLVELATEVERRDAEFRDAFKPKTVDVSVRTNNFFAAQQELERLTKPRSVTVEAKFIQRGGKFLP